MKLELKKYIEQKMVLPNQLTRKVADIRTSNKTIATLNGSFDLLHAGHLEILFQASLTADVLIVALNSDSSIKQYKSIHRPIIPLDYRLQMIASIACVDYVTFFDETDPCNILSMIKPDVHVNGPEYGMNCIEAETVKTHGGRVHIVELVLGLSTSNILEKIRTLP